jgi:hypothetical protein
MNKLSLFMKGLFWGVVVIVCAPLAWALRKDDPYDGETFSDYDDDDIGDDVDEPSNWVSGYQKRHNKDEQ